MQTSNSIDQFILCSDESWVNTLNPDPETEIYAPNKKSREVKSGHYVVVKPTPLPEPRLVTVSLDMARELGLDINDCFNDPRFVRFFSGDISSFTKPNGESFKSWATPYALSIYGTDYYQNCPFGTGNGYGDGRAVSVGEVLVKPDGEAKRWELQLKGGGTTPFCRGADGRAVLRSSVREFLASEGMFHMGISTTRALCLIVSDKENVMRPWYSKSGGKNKNPDIMVENQAAITCRVAPSFIRVGHVQLFERKVRRNQDKEKHIHKLCELFLFLKHCLFREFPEILAEEEQKGDDNYITKNTSVSELKRFLSFHGRNFDQCVEKSDMWNLAKESTSLLSPAYYQRCILSMLRKSSQKFGDLIAGWLRVGFCQGNFNSDNCLIAGRTMDYGPFGFMEKFVPLWCMWVGGGEHFGFLNQPEAAHKNFTCFAKSVLPVMDQAGTSEVYAIINDNKPGILNTVNQMWNSKLGFTSEFSLDAKNILSRLVSLLEHSQADYTIFWRELAGIVGTITEESKPADYLAVLENVVFYSPLSDTNKGKWTDWLDSWSALLLAQAKENGVSLDSLSLSLKNLSPKYVPREWMLVEAYEEAIKGNNELLLELQNLFTHPYEEQSPEMQAKYYKRAPCEIYSVSSAVGGGVNYMS
jgi:uncharacterized protein YdiU (UPF0061 family)